MTDRSPEAGAAMLLATPAAVAAVCTGGPCLLVLEGVEGAEALDLPGLALWRVAPSACGGGLRLHRPGGEDPATPADLLPLPAPPAGVLAVLAPDARRAAPLLAAWGDAAGVPPVVEAAEASAALPVLARLLAAECAARAAEAARLLRAGAMLREEAEETRTAMTALMQSAAGDRAPPPPVLALSAEPSAAARVEAEEGGRLALGQRLGTSLEGVAAVALHLAEAAVLTPDARLRVRLWGAEGGRVRGAWTVPGTALAPGWLALDLPAPLGPVREGALLDVAAEGLGPGDRLALSLEGAEAPPDRRAAVAEGTVVGGPDRALALRLWTAPFGRRFVLSPHWGWDAMDLPLAPAPAGVPLGLPEQVWAAARVLPEGRGAAVALGADGPARPVVALDAGERALVVLPAVPVAGLDLLEAEVAVRLGEAGPLEAALWVQPEGAAIAGEGDLSLAAPGARCTGWRPAEAARGGLSLVLRLPPGGPGMACVALALRHGGGGVAAAPGPGEAVRVEWAELTGRRLAAPVPPEDPRRAGAGPPPSPALAAAAPPDAVPRLEAVRLHELYAMEGGGYRHLDIGVEGLRVGALGWPRLRFKFAVNGEAPQIEVRARPDWPAMFERWPGGTRADEHGPFLLLTEEVGGGRALARLASERDRRMLAALLRLLPTVVATAARAATADPAEYEGWVAMARRFAGALGEGAG